MDGLRVRKLILKTYILPHKFKKIFYGKIFVVSNFGKFKSTNQLNWQLSMDGGV